MTNEAIAAIGQGTTEAVDRNRQALAEELERIRRNEDLSESAKGRLSDEASREAAERHTSIIDDYERYVASVLANNEKRLFALSYPEGALTPSQKQAFKDSYRDASFRVLNLSEDDLSRIMARAVRVGDSALESACYHESIERGLFSVANDYRERHPDARDVWETYEKTRLSEDAHGATLTRALLQTSNPGT
jgi:hypothetical protein